MVKLLLILAVFLASYCDAGAAITHVQTAKIQCTSTSCTSASITTTSGSLVILSGGGFNGLITGVSDNRAHTWTQNANSPITGSAVQTRQYCTVLSTAGAGHTFTVSASGSDFITYYVSEFSGAASDACIDKTASASGNTTTPNSGATATRSFANELGYVTACTASLNNVTWADSNGWTIPANGKEDSATQTVCAVGYKTFSSTGTDAGELSIGATARQWAAIVGTFKDATQPSTGTRPRIAVMY